MYINWYFTFLRKISKLQNSLVGFVWHARSSSSREKHSNIAFIWWWPQYLLRQKNEMLPLSSPENFTLHLFRTNPESWKKMRLILDQNRNSLEKLFGKLRANAEKCDYAELCVTFKHWYVCKLWNQTVGCQSHRGHENRGRCCALEEPRYAGRRLRRPGR